MRELLVRNMQRLAVEAVDGNIEDRVHEVFDLLAVLRVAADAVFGAEKRRQIERLRENIRRVVQIFVHTGWICDESDAFSFEDVCVSFQIVDAVHVVDPVFYRNEKYSTYTLPLERGKINYQD